MVPHFMTNTHICPAHFCYSNGWFVGAGTYALSFFILPGIITNDSSMFLGWVVHCINGFRLRYFSGLLDMIIQWYYWILMGYVFPWIFSIVSSGTIWKNAATNGEIGKTPIDSPVHVPRSLRAAAPLGGRKFQLGEMLYNESL
jgi:hypothetical protein